MEVNSGCIILNVCLVFCLLVSPIVIFFQNDRSPSCVQLACIMFEDVRSPQENKLRNAVVVELFPFQEMGEPVTTTPLATWDKCLLGGGGGGGRYVQNRFSIWY